MKTKLQLFIFQNFSPDHSGGLAFAIAKDEADARKLIEEDRGYEAYDWGTATSHPITRRIARSVSGGM